jgi:hypothetical protein
VFETADDRGIHCGPRPRCDTPAHTADSGDPQARALGALAGPLRAPDPGRTKVLGQQALAIYRELAVPDAIDLDGSAPAMVSIRLAELDNLR